MSLEKWHQVASWGSDSTLVAINDAMEELGYGEPIASGNTGHGGWGAPLLSDSPLVHIVAGHNLTSGSGYWCVVGFTEDTKFGVEAPYANGGALIRDIATHQVNLAVVFTVDGTLNIESVEDDYPEETIALLRDGNQVGHFLVASYHGANGRDDG
jgi:hypothetical protein